MRRAANQSPLASRLGVACLTVLAAGCGVGTGSSSGSIIGGTLDPGDPAVMLLFAQQPMSSSGFLCSAVLIAPTVLVTAAHCVSPQTVGQGNTFRVFSGADWNQQQNSSWLDVAAVHYDSQFDVNQLGQGHDIAVAILTSPSGEAPLPWNRTPIANTQVGQPVRLVGYGATDGKQLTGAGVKRTTTTTLDDVSSLLLHIGDSTRQTCEGDSGGPALMSVNGVPTVVGVTSFGEVGCVNGAYDTRLDVYASFLDQFVPVRVQPAPQPTTLSRP